MDSKNKIYAVSCMERIDECNTWPNYGTFKFMGYYFNKKHTFDVVESNIADINECIFKYAVIEEIYPGIYSYPRQRWFFQFDPESGTYYHINEPEVMKGIANVL